MTQHQIIVDKINELIQ